MNVKIFSKYYKNKYYVASFVFLVYILFLDDIDIFTIVNQNSKLNRLEATCESMKIKLDSTRQLYKELRSTRALERFAREKKYFKEDDEDIFVISRESQKLE